MTTTTEGRIPLEKLARLPGIFLPSVSYQGDKAAFYANVSGSTELYVLDLRTGEQRQISHGGLPKSLKTGFVWNRAGDRIVLARDNDGDEQHNLVATDVASGDLTNLTHDPECQEYPLEFSPDDQVLLVLTDKVAQLNLWRMRPDGSDYRQLTDYASPVLSAIWSPDSTRIAYIANESADLRNVDGYVMNADGSGRRRVLYVADGSQDRIVDWAGDGVTLAVSSDAAGLDRAGLLNLATGELRWLGEEGVDEHAVSFSQDGRWLLCVRNQDAQTRLVIYDTATGAPRCLMLPPGVVSAAEFALDDTALFFVATTPTSRAGLSLYSLADDSVRVLVPARYGGIDPSLFADCDHIWYDSFDGTRIPALLYRPRVAAPPEGRPAIVLVLAARRYSSCVAGIHSPSSSSTAATWCWSRIRAAAPDTASSSATRR